MLTRHPSQPRDRVLSSSAGIVHSLVIPLCISQLIVRPVAANLGAMPRREKKDYVVT